MARPTDPAREAAPAKLPRAETVGTRVQNPSLPSAHWAALSPEIFEYTEHQNMLKAKPPSLAAMESER